MSISVGISIRSSVSFNESICSICHGDINGLIGIMVIVGIIPGASAGVITTEASKQLVDGIA
jgi:hypothetical protein